MEKTRIFCETFKEEVMKRELLAAGLEILSSEPLSDSDPLYGSLNEIAPSVLIMVQGDHDEIREKVMAAMKAVAEHYAKEGMITFYGSSDGETHAG
jgi:hypothetical protein